MKGLLYVFQCSRSITGNYLASDITLNLNY